MLEQFWILPKKNKNEFCIFNDIVSFMSCLQQDAIKRRKILYVVLWYIWFKNIYSYLYASCRSSRNDLHANVFEPEYSCSTMFIAILACHFEYEVYFVFWGSIMYLRRRVFPDQTPQ
mgnify:CR=1 FL=1